MQPGTFPDVTQLLADWREGDEQALERLLPEIYLELRRLASRQLKSERRGNTLETHDLIHEAFLRLVKLRQVNWQNRTHFFAVAARMMRRILVDHARHHARGKRGGGFRTVAIEEALDCSPEPSADLVALDEALSDLAAVDPGLGRIVELRFFGGLKHEEIADLFGQSTTTVRRRWRLAKAWLYQQIAGEAEGGP